MCGGGGLKFKHDFVFFQFCTAKSKLLHPKKEKSPTCCNFEIFDHDPSFFNFSQKKASLLLVKKKSELLDQKSLTSPTCCKFEFFYHDPQLDIKF